MLKKIAIFFCLVAMSLQAAEKEEAETKKEKSKLEETVVVTSHKLNIEGKELAYRAETGNMILKNTEGQDKASIFYVAYIKDITDTSNQKERPITFCFNGGPGSSSIWLHIGMMGPKKVALDDLSYSDPPYTWEDNPHTILDQTDLVFIDPVSTGYSRAAPNEDMKQFHGVEGDVRWVAEFIRQYTTRNGRWGSPKFIAGESYGTTRAASLAAYLHSEHNLYLDGVVLISSILNFQTIHDSNQGNDLPFVLYLPTMTASAWYHQKLPEDLQKDLFSSLNKAEKFALGEYASALLYGDLLDPKLRQEIVQKLAMFTGISPDFIERTNLRITPFRFSKELLRNDRRILGRFDARYIGIDLNPVSHCMEFDPSADAIFGPFTAIMNEYLRNELKWKKDEEYVILADVQPWDFGKASNQYLNVGGNLKEVMTKNPKLKIFVGSGLYDLATPYFATDYTFHHLGLDPVLKKNIGIHYYEAGHMMYLHPPSLVKLKQDLSDWYQGYSKK